MSGEYDDFVLAARSGPGVVGLVLTGSRGRKVFVQPQSDWDVRLVVRDDSLAECEQRLGTPRGSLVEVIVLSLSEFETTAALGSANEWDRYSYAHAEVVIDKLDGRIAQLVAEKGVLPAEAADRLAAGALDAYINSYYRSVKNLRAGLRLESRLDAAESVPHFLNALFDIHRRVRPYNKFLRWELESFPLDGAPWTAAALLPRLETITASGDIAEQQALFRAVEQLAREHGLGAAIDRWTSDLPLLRGDSE